MSTNPHLWFQVFCLVVSVLCLIGTLWQLVQVVRILRRINRMTKRR